MTIRTLREVTFEGVTHSLLFDSSLFQWTVRATSMEPFGVMEHGEMVFQETRKESAFSREGEAQKAYTSAVTDHMGAVHQQYQEVQELRAQWSAEVSA